jgi:hypothetical protein
MTRVNLSNAPKLLKFYGAANGSRLPARQELMSGFEPSTEPERKICRDLALPKLDRIESIAFLVFGIVASGVTIFCFSELFHLLNSGALEHFVHSVLR